MYGNIPYMIMVQGYNFLIRLKLTCFKRLCFDFCALNSSTDGVESCTRRCRSSTRLRRNSVLAISIWRKASARPRPPRSDLTTIVIGSFKPWLDLPRLSPTSKHKPLFSLCSQNQQQGQIFKILLVLTYKKRKLCLKSISLLREGY